MANNQLKLHKIKHNSSVLCAISEKEEENDNNLYLNHLNNTMTSLHIPEQNPELRYSGSDFVSPSCKVATAREISSSKVYIKSNIEESESKYTFFKTNDIVSPKKAVSMDDRIHLDLARENRIEQVRTEIAKNYEGKMRFTKQNAGVFSNIMGYFGCC